MEETISNCNGDSDVGNTHRKVLIFVVVVLINIILVLNSPLPKGLQHRAISSQSMLSHSSALPE